MSWQTQGRKEHGHFGDGHAATSARTQQPRPAAPILKAAHQPQPLQGAASATDLHERNVKDLARVIASEANGRPLVEQTMVGQVLMNRLRRAPADWTVQQVWSGFAHNQPPTDAQRALARNIIDGKEPDISNGATHFYSPDQMPKKGDPTKGFDVGGGLEHSISPKGLPINNYRPGFAARFPSVNIPGVDTRYFRVYQQPGAGHVR